MTEPAQRWIRGFAIVFVGLLAGCSTTLGKPLRPEALEQLAVGASSAQEVRVRLGEPTGRGAMRTGSLEEAREVWSYEHFEAEGSTSRLNLLLVFLLDGRYDGHLWFSSSSLYEVEAAR